MGVFDQAARFAAQADPTVVPARLLAGSGLTLAFREWLDTRSLPLPGGADRTADLVAALDEPAGPPWLMLLEFQAQPDVDKLDVTLEEVAALRSRARHGDDRKGKYRVLAGLIYLKGRCPEERLDMTAPDGRGTSHAPFVWNVEADTAAQAVEAVSGGQLSWGMLFWVSLMAGGGEEGIIARWKEVVLALVEDRRRRGNLASITQVFAGLAGCLPAWRRGLEGFEMTESEVVNEWISLGEAKGILAERRRNLLEIIHGRFPGEAPEEVVRLIQEQESLGLLQDWLRAAWRVATFEKFLDVLKR